MSTTLANILGDALIPGLFNLIACLGPFMAFQWFCFTHFCRITKKLPGIGPLRGLTSAGSPGIGPFMAFQWFCFHPLLQDH
jgi:hypothetical protein